ncbi:unnamed protein product [Prorocentrum cordatum]|uniref:Uncharacterized protein n=1 Tax=Prorocentrum cordatum TaxID=2364126 RepID=A0ABN9YCM3_9DINO|nr:unnamed protein product [Polarella glacialis]
MGSEDRAAPSMHRRRRRHIGDVDVKQTGLHIEPHSRCVGDAGRSPDPTQRDPNPGGPDPPRSGDGGPPARPSSKGVARPAGAGGAEANSITWHIVLSASPEPQRPGRLPTQSLGWV